MNPSKIVIEVLENIDVNAARRMVGDIARGVAFDELGVEEVAIAASELASNLVKHAKSGRLIASSITDGSRIGIQIESVDDGPGISNVEQAMTDGFSTTGSLGYGLGSINRIMDEFRIESVTGSNPGTRIVAKKWVRDYAQSPSLCPLVVGAATRAHPAMAINGDAFVIKHWSESVLVAVIDGLGHGQFAHRASQAARHYVETHFDQPLADIFRGTGRSCRATRGVVMALARFDWARSRLAFASVGNIEARTFRDSGAGKFSVRRGIVGVNTPDPVVTEHHWDRDNVMVIHSDGLRSHWRWEDFKHLVNQSAAAMAQGLLIALARNDDDATVIVVKGEVL